MKKENYTGIFAAAICLFAILYYYQYPAIWQLPPQGSHLWRQTDCMAMVWNYKLFDLPFFHPSSFNLQSANGNVAGEFPLLYYIASKSGNPEFVLRVLHSIIFGGGIIGVYATAFYFLRNIFLSVVTAVLFLTSPLLVFYGNNFLSDVPAWSFAMMGWTVYLYTFKKEKPTGQYISFILFALAALLKASQAFNFGIVFLFQFSIFNSPFFIKKLIPYFLFLIPVAWYAYAKTYNAEYQNSYYFLGIYPVWKLNLHDIGLCIWRMTVSWSYNYFWRPTCVLLIVALGYVLLKSKTKNTELKNLLGSSFFFTLIYLFLFFERMMKHEYYYVVFFILAVFAVITVMQLLLPLANNKIVRMMTMIFLLINIYYCKNSISQKLHDQNYNTTLSSADFQDFLNQSGCIKNKIVVSLPDASVSQSLYWVKRKGYTEHNDYLSALKNNQADYLILNSEDQALKETIQPYLQDSLGNFHGILLYRLK